MHRLIALWAWTILLLNGSMDAAGVRGCPHDLPSAHALEGADGPLAAGYDGSREDLPGPEPEHCTCSGACLAQTSAAPSQPRLHAVVLPPLARRVQHPGGVIIPQGRIPFVLPYATAPPLLPA